MTPSIQPPALHPDDVRRLWDHARNDELAVLASDDFEVLLDQEPCPRCAQPGKELSFDLLLDNGLLVRWVIFLYCIRCRDFVFSPIELEPVARAAAAIAGGEQALRLKVERIYQPHELHQFLDGDGGAQGDPGPCPRCAGEREPVHADICLVDVPHLIAPYAAAQRCRACGAVAIADQVIDRVLDALEGPLRVSSLRPSVYHDIPRYPVKMHWELTTRCNLRCSYCTHPQLHGPGGGADTRLAEFTAMFDKLNPRGTIQAIEFTGLGEAFLNPDFLAVVRYCKERGVPQIGTVSNGTLMVPHRYRDICESGLDSLGISIDSLSRVRMKALRGINLEKILANVDGLIAYQREHGFDKPKLGFLSLLFPDTSEEEVAALVRYSFERGMMVPYFAPLESHADGPPRYYDGATQERVLLSTSDHAKTLYQAAIRTWAELHGEEVDPARPSPLLENGVFLSFFWEQLLAVDALRWVPHAYCGFIKNFVGVTQGGGFFWCPQGFIGKPDVPLDLASMEGVSDYWQAPMVWQFRFAHANKIVPRYCRDCNVLDRLHFVEATHSARHGSGRRPSIFVGAPGSLERS